MSTMQENPYTPAGETSSATARPRVPLLLSAGDHPGFVDMHRGIRTRLLAGELDWLRQIKRQGFGVGCTPNRYFQRP